MEFGDFSRKDYVYFAEVCFKEFGDRVKHWTTFNEPNMFIVYGYFMGEYPPLHCSPPYGTNCTTGDSKIEFYVAAHNLIVSHAMATNLYRTKYKVINESVITFTIGYIPRLPP